jgi:hypothetical protein
MTSDVNGAKSVGTPSPNGGSLDSWALAVKRISPSVAKLCLLGSPQCIFNYRSWRLMLFICIIHMNNMLEME